MTLFRLLPLLGLIGLAACGDTIGERAAFGGVAGGAGTAVAGGDPLAGAAVGAAGNVAFCELYPHRC